MVRLPVIREELPVQKKMLEAFATNLYFLKHARDRQPLNALYVIY